MTNLLAKCRITDIRIMKQMVRIAAVAAAAVCLTVAEPMTSIVYADPIAFRWDGLPAETEESEKTAGQKSEANDLGSGTEGYVRRVCRAILQREPSDEDLASWTGLMESEGYHAGKLVRELLSSDEYAASGHTDQEYKKELNSLLFHPMPVENASEIIRKAGEQLRIKIDLAKLSGCILSGGHPRRSESSVYPYDAETEETTEYSDPQINRSAYLSQVLKSDEFLKVCAYYGVPYQAFEIPEGWNITWIGDSYSVMAEGLIEQEFPGVDLYAAYSKHTQMDAAEGAGGSSGLSILYSIVAAGALRPYLVFALGTNDPIPSTDVYASYIDTVMALAGDDTVVVFVTPYTMNAAQGEVSYQCEIDAMRNAEAYYPNARVADWADFCQPYLGQFFSYDSIHPVGPGGIESWVELIAEALKS